MKSKNMMLIVLLFTCTLSWRSSFISNANGMDYIKVCVADDDCKHFSRLICGSDHLSASAWLNENQTQPSQEEVFRVLDEALNAGINLFDTSPIYVGGVENLLGKWRVSRLASGAAQGKNPDNSIYVLSKAGFPFDLYYSKALPPGNHSKELIAALTESGILNASTVPNGDGSIALQNVPPGTYASRLFGDTDQIVQRVVEELGHIVNNLQGNVTILLMHRDDNDYLEFDRVTRNQTSVETIINALNEPKIRSHVWGFGWSNWETSRVKDSLRAASALKFPLLFNSPYFSLFEMNVNRSIHAGGVQALHSEMQDPTFQSGMLLNPYSPLGGWSILDQPGLWQDGRANAKLHLNDPYWMNVLSAIFTNDNDDRFSRLKLFADRTVDYSLDQVANAYCLAHARTDFLTIGPITVEEIKRSIQSLSLSKVLASDTIHFLYGN